MIKSQHSDHAAEAFQRKRQRGTQRAEFRGIVQIARLDRRIAIDDRLAVLCHPAGQALPQRDAQRFKQPEVVSADVLGQQEIPAAHVDGDRIVGHQALELHQCFVEAERGAEILAEFEQRLRFLPRRGDGSEEGRLFVFRAGCDESGGGSCPAFHLQVGGKF